MGLGAVGGVVRGGGDMSENHSQLYVAVGIVPLPCQALVLPKSVTLTNTKLNVLYYLISFAMFLFLAIRFMNLEQNSVVAVPNGQVSIGVRYGYLCKKAPRPRSIENIRG